jgi:hypothetical protein
MTNYIPTWERPDSVTRNMSEIEMVAHYKRTSVSGDCAFALRDGTSTPLDILNGWRFLYADLHGRKETPTDRAIVQSLRACWRQWHAGDAYTVPVVAVTARKRKTPARLAGCCPTCGHVAIAA